MASFNKISLVGYLGRDPELRYTPQSTAVCNFSMATTERKKDKAGEYQDVTTWFNVTVWGNRGEAVAQNLSKGSFVFVDGCLTAREYNDREGNARTSLDVNASDVKFLTKSEGNGDGGRQQASGRPPASRGSGQQKQSQQPADTAAPAAEDDIPF